MVAAYKCLLSSLDDGEVFELTDNLVDTYNRSIKVNFLIFTVLLSCTIIRWLAVIYHMMVLSIFCCNVILMK